MNLRFCYKITKDFVDETGVFEKPLKLYTMIEVETDSYSIPKEQYQDMVETVKKQISEERGIDEKLIMPITLNEYLDEIETCS